MQTEKKQLPALENTAALIVYLLLAVAGLSFCFFLGFPFDNHNESYLWMVFLTKATFADTLTKHLTGGIESFRPLGMANAWLSYHMTGNIYLQQILNWLFAAVSFGILFFAAHNKILFSFLSFITCAFFFSGYIYLFHLHGVFYGPFQLYVAILTVIAVKEKKLSTRMLAASSVATIVVCLYHTFALLVFCGFLAGYILQLGTAAKRKEYARLVISLVLTLALAKLILQSKEMKTAQILSEGLIVSYRLAENNLALSLIAAILVTLAAASAIKSRAFHAVTFIISFLLCFLFIYLNQPVLILWVLVCAGVMMLKQNWAMAGLVGATAILPLGSGSGSPTYVIFVLMICTFITATSGKNLHIRDTTFLKIASVSGMALLLICLLTLKQGIKIPVAAAIARPILAEQEKTKQFKNIVSWKINNKKYAPYSLSLADSGGVPAQAKNVLARANRPVTGQLDVNAYLDFFSVDNMPNAQKIPVLYVTFGDKILPGKKLIYAVNGTWNGKAFVFR